MIEYGYDINDMKAFTDESLSVEIPIESISKDALEKILGGVAITRCKDCKHWYEKYRHGVDMSACKRAIGYFGANDYCSRAERKEK